MTHIPVGEPRPLLPTKQPVPRETDKIETTPLGIGKISPSQEQLDSKETFKDKISQPPSSAQKIEALQGKETLSPGKPKQKKYASKPIEEHLKNITDKSALGHIHGDAFLKNTGLEGNQSKHMCQLALSHIQNILENNELVDKPLNSKEIQTLNNMKSDLDQAISFARILRNTTYRPHIKEQFAQQLKPNLRP